MTSGILPGKHVKVSEQLNDKLLSRFYSPVSDPNMQGFFEIVFKVYPVSESDPLLGIFSRYMGSRKKGDRVKIAGPFGALAYKGHGRFENLKGEVKSYRKIGMIAGGTRITPLKDFREIEG
ncbi:hypothetical protein AAVH_16845 [Aphelenchoides avenae]|nr:hypothetical protein AAVH_16844 [Aphelenchus avenae]KAH7715757.1 hypothetical protein AAVH_16845 [Aphelenchus avenae]